MYRGKKRGREGECIGGREEEGNERMMKTEKKRGGKGD